MSKTIQEAVAEKIAQKGTNVAEIVVDKLVDIEIQRRVEIITKAIKKQDDSGKEFSKLNKNDVVTYINGEPNEAMSKNRFDEIKKAKEQLDKLGKLINDALTQNTTDAYNKLSDFLK